MLLQLKHLVEEAPRQLEEGEKAKLHAMLDFVGAFIGELSPVQSARGHLAAFPHIMDTLAVTELLGAQFRVSVCCNLQGAPT